MWDKWPSALRVSVYYGIFGSAWILLSDWAVNFLAHNAGEIQFLQTFKGIIFVLLSMLVVFLLSHHESQRRRDIEGEAQQLHDILGRAMRTAGAAAFVYNRNTGQVVMSDGISHLLGQPSVQTRIEWDQWMMLIHPKDQKRLSNALENCFRKGNERLDITVRAKHKNGHDLALHIQGVPVAKAGRDKDRLIGSLSDVTAVRRAEEEAARTASLLNALLRANHQTIVAKDEQTMFDNVCTVLTDEARFRLAWISLPPQQEKGQARIVASAGNDVIKAAVQSDPKLMAQGNAIALDTIRSGTIQVVETACQCDDKNGETTSTSIVAVPIHAGSDVIGVLNVYGELPYNFNEAARAVLRNVGDDIGFALHNMRRREKLHRAEEHNIHLGRQLEETLIGAVKALSLTVELRDPYTAGHQERVAELATAMAQELKLPEQQIQHIRLGALMHDLGKIRVPAEILTRPGRLAREEFEMIKPHPLHGVEIARHVGLPEAVINVIGQHHERLDGSGYPKGLAGDEISLEARIVAVADTVEAMSSHRPYRPAHGVTKALELISQQADKTLDKRCVNACVRLFKQKGFKFSTSFGLVRA